MAGNESGSLTVTQSVLDESARSAGEIITQTVEARASGDARVLNLDGGVIVDILVCKTLIPILVAVTSGLSLKYLITRGRKEESLNDMREALKTFLGQPISLPDETAKEDLVSAVRAQLGQFSDADMTARTVVNTILQKLTETCAVKKRG